MIYNGTKLICNDNSGAILVKCIGLKTASKHKGAKIGDLIVVSIKSCSKGLDKIKKGTIQYGVIVWLQANINWFTKNASYIKFFQNNIVLLSRKNNFSPMGTWILGPVANELWVNKFIKVVLLSAGIF